MTEDALLHIPAVPRFTTARGRIADWYDLERRRAARQHYARLRAQAHQASIAASRAAHPDWPEYRHGPFPLPTPDARETWEPEALIHEVHARLPDASLTVSYRPRDGTFIPIARKVVNPRFWRFQSLEGFGGLEEIAGPNDLSCRDDADDISCCYGPQPNVALALLRPRCFFHGRELRGTPVATTVLGRPALLIPLQRLIPLTDPRILGDALNPPVLDEAEETEVVVDRERGVILEWRALFDGQPYERHFFTDIHFDEPMSEEEFSPETPLRS